MEAALPFTDAMTASEFFAFTDTRPDEEKWELLDGIPVLNPTPSFLHQIILQNMIVLLSRAKREMAASWTSVPGFGLRVTDKNVPVPDLMVRPNTLLHAQDCKDALVAIEILSPSTAHRDRRWKRSAHANLASLQQYVIVAQDSVNALSYERRDNFMERRITGADGSLALPSLGVSLPLADIYLDPGL